MRTKLLFCFLFCSVFVYGQYGKDVAFKGGVGYFDGVYGELSLHKFRYKDDGGVLPSKGSNVGIGLEYFNTNNQSLFGAKLEYSYWNELFTIGTELEYLTSESFLKENEINIKPIVGLTFLDVVSILYSYSINLGGNTDFKDYGRHGIRLKLIIPVFMSDNNKIYDKDVYKKTFSRK